MSAIPSRSQGAQRLLNNNVTALIPDFPFHYAWYLLRAAMLKQPLGRVPEEQLGAQVLIVGAGVSGLVAAYEAMRMGLHPIVVEASGRIGGRLYSHVVGDRNDPQNRVICELGAMRFPKSGKALMHYFDKVGMSTNSADFPNPGSPAAPSTVVDYKNEQTYYERDNLPDKYRRIEDMFFDDFLAQDPIRFADMEAAMSEGQVNQDEIKAIWNTILRAGWDGLSFYAAMVEQAKWSREDIDLFGQIGFGTGGWNTDYPNCFLEVLRVLYTGLDTNHTLMYDGSSELPQRLWSGTPASFGDALVHWPADTTVESLTRREIADPLNQEVRQIIRLKNGTFDVYLHDNKLDSDTLRNFKSVVYTPHVRILDKFRYMDGKERFTSMNNLLPQATWEAVMYTHYMQSAKIFATTRRPFWSDLEGGRYKMSVTLSDRLTRGTYLLDYGPGNGVNKGSGMFLSYTWNDDSLKFLGDRSAPLPSHVQLCTTLLDTVYANTQLNLAAEFGMVDPFVEINWEDEPFYLCAFKMNLPGQYEYQRLLFSQFMSGVKEGEPDGFILSGDDISWTGGWAEGAVTTALNAVNKLAVTFGGGAFENNPGPIDQWDALQPLQL
ncbi:amine oxidase [Pseudomonas brenneri]|jgi:tryptophan 2-monooxygenase|uniref:Tryptophan 2-monooxygenase n=1 Tax=Pseudomonas brenneri TaxID=129817 RepID=A0A5B2V3Y7_9PSED|nr:MULTISPECIES: NAD(P)/FAD-dependent oxidoreductase [Pseudomonas]KAA2232937.1 NAD(P)-binding protein [Pseudomonas brenneri]TWR75803.1 FAD-dependent oxidoreductase [Pseudomonas brenneri]CRM26300.1 Tryptophan 2-monooxygenase [Pseudomonas sp. 25 R 14]SDV06816.1 tryptophan 2-monooxygenase [Pseudomonas brenneri]GGL33503.1 amine oxidase [Pseudomonas brenneri]